MNDAALLNAIDAIYTAAPDRYLWGQSLLVVAGQLQASGAMLLTQLEGRAWHIVASSGVADELVHSYNDRWNTHDPFVAALSAEPAEDAVTLSSLDVRRHSGPFVNFFCQPAGWRSGLLAMARDRSCAAVFWRPDDSPFGSREQSFVRRLWPHVMRVRQLHQAHWEMSPTRSNVWTEAVLDLWPVGVIVLSGDGRLVRANRAARKMAAASDGIAFAVDGPVAWMARDSRALRDTIRRVADGTSQAPEWLRISRRSGARPYELGLCRLTIPSEPAAVVMFIAEPDGPRELDHVGVRKLYGLTDLECRVAECLVRGLTVQDMADVLALTPQTVRWYVQQVRQKMDAKSQGEVVRLLLHGLTGLPLRACLPD